MSDDFFVPGLPDGMAAFEGPDGHAIVVRNHEVNVGSRASLGPFGEQNAKFDRLSPEDLYDAGAAGSPCLGGTTTFVWDLNNRRLVSQHLSLAGTLRNCAGGSYALEFMDNLRGIGRTHRRGVCEGSRLRV